MFERPTSLRLARPCLVALALAAPAIAQTPLHTFTGDSPFDEFGEAVDGAGDVDNDGHDDLIVGAHWDDESGVNVGSARVFSGKDGSILHTFYGSAANDQLGRAVSGAGDVNNDGFADVIAATPLADVLGNDAGTARVWSGKDGAVLHTFHGDSAGDGLGFSVSEAGDVDGDGFDDVVVGAYRDSVTFGAAGSVFVFSGKDGTTLHAFHGDFYQDWLGSSVSGAGDVNGDGFADVVGGAPVANEPGLGAAGADAGMVRVWSGKDGAALFTFYGDSYGHELGTSVGGAGDVNGDGRDDVIAGAPEANSAAGYARVWSGADGAVLHTFVGTLNAGRVGSQVAGAGDVDGDGRSDVIVGAPWDGVVGANGYGTVRIHSGQTGATLATVTGKFGGEFLGDTLGAAGDVDADGVPDFVVGSNMAAGAAFVLSGGNVPPAHPPFGAGCAGSLGTAPILSLVGSSAAGGHLTLTVDHLGASNAPGVLLGGLAETSLPAGCGCSLLVQPVVLQLPLALDPFGMLFAGFTIPPGLSGATVKLQLLLADAGNPCGFSATNGVSLSFP
ncbi:MAG: integrin alpha [Planctomycetota bacterium JB042]